MKELLKMKFNKQICSMYIVLYIRANFYFGGFMVKEIKCNIFDSGTNIICHQVNCQGVMGSGLAKQVKEKFPHVYMNYSRYCDEYKQEGKSPLGTWQAVPINYEDIEDRYIVNIFAQDRYGYTGVYTQYGALRTALESMKRVIEDMGYSVAFPKYMGCKRGGGDWNIVRQIIEDIFGRSKLEILICECDKG